MSSDFGSALKYNMYGSIDMESWVKLGSGVLPESVKDHHSVVYPLTAITPILVVNLFKFEDSENVMV